MSDPEPPSYLQTPPPEEMLAGCSPRCIPVRAVGQVPDASEEDQGAWTTVNASYLESIEAHRPCPPTRFRLVRTPPGIVVRIECHVPPLEAAGEERLVRDTASLLVWPSSGSGDGPALYLEHVVSPRGFAETYCVANQGATVEMWTPELADEDRPRQRITLRYSLERTYAWIADILLPWGVFRGLGDAPPDDHARWRGNVVRIHPGSDGPLHAAWHPTPTTDHHHLASMGTLVFPPSAAAEAAAAAEAQAAARRAQTRTMPRRTSIIHRLR